MQRPVAAGLAIRSQAIKATPECRRDWLLNLFWHAGKNSKKIRNYKGAVLLLKIKLPLPFLPFSLNYFYIQRWYNTRSLKIYLY
jgi:hypothetical protein